MENEDNTTETTSSSESQGAKRPSDAWEGALPPEIAATIEAAKRLALASLGAVTLATEATDELFQQLVKRGELSREELARELEEVKERGASRKDDATTYVKSRVDSVLSRVSVASKADVESLSAQVNTLTERIEELQSGRSRSFSSVEAPPETGSE